MPISEPQGESSRNLYCQTAIHNLKPSHGWISGTPKPVVHDTPERRRVIHIPRWRWTYAHRTIYVRNMSRKIEIELLAQMAKTAGCCIDVEALPHDRSLHRALQRRVTGGIFVRPYKGLYLPATCWIGMNPVERARTTAVSLARRHSSWVFTGPTAAIFHGLEVPWNVLHRTTVVSAGNGDTSSSAPLRKIYAPSVPIDTIPSPVLNIRNHDHGACGNFMSAKALCSFLSAPAMMSVTTVERALVDCAMHDDFRYALAAFDSAFRQRRTTADAIIDACDSVSGDCGPVFRALHYTDPLAENGGESLCRALIVEYGYAVPKLQREFVDPANSFNKARVDFVWHLPDGRVIVLEYDGMQKYVDPRMTNRRSVQQVVRDQLERDALLKRAGVTTIVHATYDDVRNPLGLVAKLDRAEVPMRTGLRFFEHG